MQRVLGTETGRGVRIAAGTEPSSAILREVHRVHDRYLCEIVEDWNLCPFARRSRQQGRVHRAVFWAAEPDRAPGRAARTLADVAAQFGDAEIVLLTFVIARRHPWADAEAFEHVVRQVRASYVDDNDGSDRFYMVGFHPRAGTHVSGKPTQDNLVPFLRQTPDPVIQCIRADVLDRVRIEAQHQATARLQREVEALPTPVRTLLLNSIQTESELSGEIARHNFRAVGSGHGRARLDALLRDLRADRAQSYGFALGP